MKITALNKKVSKTVNDKKVTRKMRKKDFIALLGEAQKFPLSMRIAAELFRSGLTGKEFLASFHIEGNTFSWHICEHMTKFDLQKGFDPKAVPPVAPIFLRYVESAKVKEFKEKNKKGRPTTEEARKTIIGLTEEYKKRGWHEIDFINAFRSLVDADTPAIKKVSLDPDLVEVEETKKTEKVYFARIGTSWERFTTKISAQNAMDADDHKVLGPVEVPVTGLHCAHCNCALNGNVTTVRNEKASRHMHPGCYWMYEAHPSQITVGMEVMNAKTGKIHRFYGQEKGGWKVKDEDIHTENPVVEGGNVSPGVPALSGPENIQAATLPVKK